MISRHGIAAASTSPTTELCLLGAVTDLWVYINIHNMYIPPYDRESTRRTSGFQDLVGDPETMPAIGIGFVGISFSKPAPGALTL